MIVGQLGQPTHYGGTGGSEELPLLLVFSQAHGHCWLGTVQQAPRAERSKLAQHGPGVSRQWDGGVQWQAKQVGLCTDNSVPRLDVLCGSDGYADVTCCRPADVQHCRHQNMLSGLGLSNLGAAQANAATPAAHSTRLARPMRWNGGSPFRLHSACTSTAAATLPVANSTQTAYQPNTVVYMNCSRHMATTPAVSPHCCASPHAWCRWHMPKNRGVRKTSALQEYPCSHHTSSSPSHVTDSFGHLVRCEGSGLRR